MCVRVVERKRDCEWEKERDCVFKKRIVGGWGDMMVNQAKN